MNRGAPWIDIFMHGKDGLKMHLDASLAGYRARGGKLAGHLLGGFRA